MRKKYRYFGGQGVFLFSFKANLHINFGNRFLKVQIARVKLTTMTKDVCKFWYINRRTNIPTITLIKAVRVFSLPLVSSPFPTMYLCSQTQSLIIYIELSFSFSFVFFFFKEFSHISMQEYRQAEWDTGSPQMFISIYLLVV